MATSARLPSVARPFRSIAAGDLRSDLDLTVHELRSLLALASEVKRSPQSFRTALSGHYLALLFEKPSLRTRFTFELAIKQLGGDSVSASGPVGGREPVKDVARNLERWVSGIVARTFSQHTVEELARWAAVPVINALTDLYHPCQALADVLTLQERLGRLDGSKLAFVGDGNNVAHSLMLTATRLGMDVAVATPDGYAPNPDVVSRATEFARSAGTRLTVTHDPREAVGGAVAVYTDVWASMGQEHEAGRRANDFENHRVDEALLAQAAPGAVFMHCLPARRGEETTDGVIESPNSVVFEQAENRLHVQKALLLMLLAR
jgi:ornithine carbamoyltransferase